jgi:hypothetical protein
VIHVDVFHQKVAAAGRPLREVHLVVDTEHPVDEAADVAPRGLREHDEDATEALGLGDVQKRAVFTGAALAERVVLAELVALSIAGLLPGRRDPIRDRGEHARRRSTRDRFLNLEPPALGRQRHVVVQQHRPGVLREQRHELVVFRAEVATLAPRGERRHRMNHDALRCSVRHASACQCSAAQGYASPSSAHRSWLPSTTTLAPGGNCFRVTPTPRGSACSWRS